MKNWKNIFWIMLVCLWVHSKQVPNLKASSLPGYFYHTKLFTFLKLFLTLIFHCPKPAFSWSLSFAGNNLSSSMASHFTRKKWRCFSGRCGGWPQFKFYFASMGYLPDLFFSLEIFSRKYAEIKLAAHLIKDHQFYIYIIPHQTVT